MRMLASGLVDVGNTILAQLVGEPGQQGRQFFLAIYGRQARLSSPEEVSSSKVRSRRTARR